ncbi:hypothetical protein [Streptomyces prunicolor]|uniref:hypothetical protein n=1 Tax=Streptomyces prunicolor TaxID=67348 RepID=UPI0003612FCC|nr:hypothetical protein [Streptomyces prunicolor]
MSTSPYAVEVTRSVSLVLTPDAIAILSRIVTSDDGPEHYEVQDIDGGGPYVIRSGSETTLLTRNVGVLHERCAHNPEDAARFDTRPQALVYASHALAACWPCTTPSYEEPE